MSVVTISRLDACRGEEVAAEVARRLGFRLVDRVVMKDLLYSYDLLASLGKIEGPGTEGDEQIREVTEGIIRHLAYRENIVLLGYGGQFLFRRWPSTFHVRIIASLEQRLRHLDGSEGGKGGEGTAGLLRGDGRRRRLVKKYSGQDLSLPEHYDLTLRMDDIGVEEAAEIIVCGIGGRQWSGGGDPAVIGGYGRERGLKEIVLEPLPDAGAEESPFAHPSEAEFARILDFYQIPWEYEPTTFPIRWSPEGSVLESFTPDFYLPEMDLYLELTTMKQALVTKKNRKIRLFRELYPERKLNIFYGRDYRKLAFKYGLE